MIRKITGIAAALFFTGMTGLQPVTAQSGDYAECFFYAQQTCAYGAWQYLTPGYSSSTACRNAYFNHCYYGDPLDPLAYKPDAAELNAIPATKVTFPNG